MTTTRGHCGAKQILEFWEAVCFEQARAVKHECQILGIKVRTHSEIAKDMVQSERPVN